MSFACLLGFVVVDGRMNGAPVEACETGSDIVPSHSDTSITPDSFPYCVDLSQFYNYSYTPGENYTSEWII